MPLIHIVLLTLVLTANAHSQAMVYRCVDAGGVTYSDRPCAPHAQAIAVQSERVSLYEPPAPSQRSNKTTTETRTKRASTSARAEDDSATKKKEACAKLSTNLEAIDSKLRAGYSAKEGIRLEDRRRSLKARARELRC